MADHHQDSSSCSSHQSETWRLSREIRIPLVFPMIICCIGSKGAQGGAACKKDDKNSKHHLVKVPPTIRGISCGARFVMFQDFQDATLLWHPQTPLMSSACFCLASAPSGTLQGVGTSADSWSNTQPPWSPLLASFIRASCVSQSCQLDKSTDSVSYAELGPRWMIYRCLKTFYLVLVS